MRNVVLHEAARRDLAEAVAYLESARSYYGILFLEAYDAAIERLLTYPRAGRQIQGDVRRWVLTKWKYSIFYSVEPDGIYILAIGHHSRHPEFYRDRLRR